MGEVSLASKVTKSLVRTITYISPLYAACQHSSSQLINTTYLVCIIYDICIPPTCLLCFDCLCVTTLLSFPHNFTVIIFYRVLSHVLVSFCTRVPCFFSSFSLSLTLWRFLSSLQTGFVIFFKFPVIVQPVLFFLLLKKNVLKLFTNSV